MNNAVMYMGSLTKVSEILIIAGAEADASVIDEVCKIGNYKSVTIVAENGDISSGSTCKIISVADIESYRAEDEEYAVFFHMASEDTVNKAAASKPKYLVGTVDANKVDSFKIWEAFRKNTKEIYINNCFDENREEVCSWSKNENSDIELSVIFPVYNVAPYLDKCIESISQWKTDYVEYLFVDDGSPDNSAEIISKYAEKDPRIKLLRKTNGGCASARQYGLDNAKGRYIGFIDPDDFIDPTMFEKLFKRALFGSYEISYCGYNELYEVTGEVQKIDDVLWSPYTEGTCDPHAINELIAYRRIAIWRGIYKRELIERGNIHFYTDLRRFDDLPFKVETLAKARSVVCVPEYLYYYRMARPGQDVAADDERLYVHFDIFKYLDAFLKKDNNEEQINFLQHVKIHTHQWALEKIRPEFIDEYCKMARKDLLSNMTTRQSAEFLKKTSSRRTRAYNLAICTGNFRLVKLIIKRAKRTN